MGEIHVPDSFIELRGFTLQHGSNIHRMFSPAWRALQEALRSTANHLDCRGAFWISSEQDSDKIFIIIEWKNCVQDAVPRTPFPLLEPFVSSKILPSTRINGYVKEFSGSNTCSLHTWYFPIGLISDDSIQANVHSRIRDFTRQFDTLSENLSSPKSMTSAWGTTTVQAENQEMCAYTLCSTWANGSSDENFRLSDDSWKRLRDDIKALGCVSERGHHGRLLQVWKSEGKYGFDDDDEEEEIDEEGLDLQLDKMSAAVARMKGLSGRTLREIGSRTHHDCRDFQVPDADGTGRIQRLKRIE